MNSKQKKTIVIGDVHGCLDELKTLLDKVGFDKEVDRAIVAGDAVDRGPDSPGVVRFMRENNIEFVKGNHDTKLLRRADHMHRVATRPGYRNPMKYSPDQESTVKALSGAEISWMDSCPFYIELATHNAFVVHAGVVPGIPMDRQTPEALTMCRYVCEKTNKMMAMKMPGFIQPEGSVFWAEKYQGNHDIIFGHQVLSLEEVIVWENEVSARCYAIDTGCCFGGRLTALVTTDDKPGDWDIVQVQANKVYFPRGETHSQ